MLAAAAFALVLSAQQSDPGFDNVWREHGAELEASGFTRELARGVFLWTEGQALIGQCRPYLSETDVAHWRGWWDGTPLGDNPYGRAMLDVGDAAFARGLEAAITDPLTADHCQRVLDSWIADVRAAAPNE
jgi:hypothetical protein